MTGVHSKHVLDLKTLTCTECGAGFSTQKIQKELNWFMNRFHGEDVEAELVIAMAAIGFLLCDSKIANARELIDFINKNAELEVVESAENEETH